MNRPTEFRCSSCRRVLATVAEIPLDRTVTVPTCPQHSGRLTPSQIKSAVTDNRLIPIPYTTITLKIPPTADRVVPVDPVGPADRLDPAKDRPFAGGTGWDGWADVVGRGGAAEVAESKRGTGTVMTYFQWISAGRPIELGLTVKYDD